MYEANTPPTPKKYAISLKIINKNKSFFVNKYGKRNSNIEFLRILSMFMILGLHVNVFSIGVPTNEECITQPFSSFMRCTFEMLCIISVNLFVLISGWFSIKFKIKGLAKFIFQCIFILSLIYGIGVEIGYAELSPRGILECGALMNNAWFIPSYIGLFILSPVLNIFCEKSNEKQLRFFLIVFYIFQTIYGNLFPNTPDFAKGFSSFSFIGLYILARYLRLYGKRLIKYAPIMYIGSTLGLILWSYLPILFKIPYINYMTFIYTCPLNVIAAASLLLWVASQKLKTNYIINFISASVFSVYLCHICNGWTQKLFREISFQLYNKYSGISYLLSCLLFMAGIFIFSILIDQLRKIAWNFFSSSKSYRYIRTSLYSS